MLVVYLSFNWNTEFSWNFPWKRFQFSLLNFNFDEEIFFGKFMKLKQIESWYFKFISCMPWHIISPGKKAAFKPHSAPPEPSYVPITAYSLFCPNDVYVCGIKKWREWGNSVTFPKYNYEKTWYDEVSEVSLQMQCLLRREDAEEEN